MRSYEQRLASFTQGWTLHHNDARLCPKRLAGLGFYYTGHDDRIRCAYCSLELSHWTGDHDPANDHRRWAADCPFFTEGLENTNRYASPPLAPNLMVRSPYFPALDMSVREDQLCLMETRVASFRNWPYVLRHMVFAMSLTGFYYTNVGDAVRCYVCQFTVRDWTGVENPETRHAEVNENCPLLRFGTNSHLSCERSTSVPPPDCLYTTPPPAPSTLSRNTLATAPPIEQVFAPSFSLPKCVKCRAETVSAVLVPCFEFCVCRQCALACDECPACHTKTTGSFSVTIPCDQLSTISIEEEDGVQIVRPRRPPTAHQH